jgi:hypothetical protein
VTVRLADLARDLGVDYRTLRGWVSRNFPRASSDVWQPWGLSPEQVRAAREHFSGHEGLAQTRPPANGGPAGDFTADWYWEGNVIIALARSLEAEGWTVRRTADAGRREQGVDLVAVSGGRTLMVEAKGYPTTTYTRGPQAGQPKPTLPVSQARQWFSHALLECVLMRRKYPMAEIAMAFPRMETYLRLIERTRSSLARLGFGVYAIASDGRTQVLVQPQSPES